MREVATWTPGIMVCAKDEPGAGGACHQYGIYDAQKAQELTSIKFQDSQVGEVGINGCQHEDLLAIVIDRLQHFQKGPFPCKENAHALAACEEALHWLHTRTANRLARGVEGKTEA